MGIDGKALFYIILAFSSLFFSMSNFIKDSTEELEHVVWPTNAESKKYMTYTVGVIVILATILAILGFGIREVLHSIRAQFPHETVATNASGSDDAATRADVDALVKNLKTKSGSHSSGSVMATPLPTATGTAQ